MERPDKEAGAAYQDEPSPADQSKDDLQEDSTKASTTLNSSTGAGEGAAAVPSLIQLPEDPSESVAEGEMPVASRHRDDIFNVIFPTVILPRIIPYFSTQHLRLWRLISRPCSTYLNQVIRSRVTSNASPLAEFIPTRPHYYCCRGEELLARDTSRLQTLAGDPDYLNTSATGRFLQFYSEDTLGQTRDVLPTITPLLPKAWVFSLYNDQTELEHYKILSECLSHLDEHLAALIITNDNPHPTPEEMNAVEDYCSKNPLPTPPLPDLEYVKMSSVICIEGGRRLATPIYQAILGAYPSQIRFLEVPPHRLQRGQISQLRNLRELHLTQVMAEDITNFPSIFESTGRSLLEKLIVECREKDPSLRHSYVSPKHLFGSLSHLPYLQSLEIECTNGADWRLSEVPGVSRLPHLTKLKIEDFQFMSIDILLEMPALEQLHIGSVFVSYEQNSDYSETVDHVDLRLFLFNGQMYRSNVWGKLVNLQRIIVDLKRHGRVVRHLTFTRAEYQARLDAGGSWEEVEEGNQVGEENEEGGDDEGGEETEEESGEEVEEGNQVGEENEEGGDDNSEEEEA